MAKKTKKKSAPISNQKSAAKKVKKKAPLAPKKIVKKSAPKAAKKNLLRPTKKKTVKPIKKVAKPVKKVTKPVKKVTKPVKKVTKPVKKVTKPVKKVAAKKAVKVASAKPIKKGVKTVQAVKGTPLVKKSTKPVLVSKKVEAVKTTMTAPTNFPKITEQRPIAHTPSKKFKVPENKTYYNDEELKEFETLILQKLEQAKAEFSILKDTLNRTNDQGADFTGGNTKVLEDGAETSEKENVSQLAARQLKYITNLGNALIRIKSKTYGICSVTGKLIPKQRLIAVPHTTHSIEAKMMNQD